MKRHPFNVWFSKFTAICAGVGYGLAVSWKEPTRVAPVSAIVCGLALAAYLALDATEET